MKETINPCVFTLFKKLHDNHKNDTECAKRTTDVLECFSWVQPIFMFLVLIEVGCPWRCVLLYSNVVANLKTFTFGITNVFCGKALTLLGIVVIWAVRFNKNHFLLYGLVCVADLHSFQQRGRWSITLYTANNRVGPQKMKTFSSQGYLANPSIVVGT